MCSEINVQVESDTHTYKGLAGRFLSWDCTIDLGPSKYEVSKRTRGIEDINKNT